MQEWFARVGPRYHCWSTSGSIIVKQVPLTALMVMSGWLEGRVREKDEWRLATMEYGGQCVTPAGMRWMLMWSVINLDTEEVWGVVKWHSLTLTSHHILDIYLPAATVMNTFGVGNGPPLLYNVSCTQTHSRLSQCVYPVEVGLFSCQHGTVRAGVSCEAAVTSPPVTDTVTTFTTQVSNNKSLETTTPHNPCCDAKIPTVSINISSYSSRETTTVSTRTHNIYLHSNSAAIQCS